MTSRRMRDVRDSLLPLAETPSVYSILCLCQRLAPFLIDQKSLQQTFDRVSCQIHRCTQVPLIFV